MNEPFLFDEILLLTLHRQRGEATEEEVARLERLLDESDDGIVCYLKIIADGIAIRECAEARASELLNAKFDVSAFAGQDGNNDVEPINDSKRVVRWPVRWYVFAAACFAIVAFGVLFSLSPPASDRSRNVAAQSARVINTSGIEWIPDAKRFYSWSPIIPGDALRFRGGSISLFISNGVELLIEGPADVRFESLERVIVAEGRLAARVGPEAIGFSIETPHANVIDRGTSFGISVDNVRQTDVVVYEGIVDLDVVGHGEQPRHRLTTGEALRVNDRGNLSRISSVQGDRFVSPPQARMAANRRAPVIESVSDNIRLLETAKFNRVIPGGFDEDCRAYVDREHEWNGITDAGLPSLLLGGDYVMTFNEDKTATELEFTVALAQPANLYLLIDNRVPPPAWLIRDFKDTNLEVGLDEVHRHVKLEAAAGPGKSLDQFYSVWHREVREASNIVLGPLGHEQYDVPARVVKRGMYGIVATPLVSTRGIDR